MTRMHKIIIVLTGLLFLIGSMLVLTPGLLQFGTDGDAFGDETAYEEVRGKGELPKNAPDLPACAKDVLVDTDDEGVLSLSFVCDNRTEREAYVAQVKNAFEWNIFVSEGNRIQIERVVPES